MGATSFLYRLEGMYLERSTYLPARGTDALELFGGLADRLASGPVDSNAGRLPIHAPLDRLARGLSERGADAVTPWLVLVDGPVSSDAAHELFGTVRDELFALPLRWVVVAPADRAAQYLTPPADVFFDLVAHLDPLTTEQQRRVLDLRGIDLPEARLREVLELADGTPRHLLALARAALLDPDRSLTPEAPTEDADAHLSRSAATLLAELQGRGPVTAADPDLRRHLNWSETRVRRTLQELVGAGVVRASQGSADGPGRPPVLYHLAPSSVLREWE